MSCEEEDTCMSCEEEDTCMSCEEEDTCMSCACMRRRIHASSSSHGDDLSLSLAYQ